MFLKLSKNAWNVDTTNDGKYILLLSCSSHCNEEAKFPLSRGRIDSWMCYGANEWKTLVRSILLSWTCFGAKDDMCLWGVMEHGCETLEAMDETLIMRNLYVNNFIQLNIRVWIHLMGTNIDHSSHMWLWYYILLEMRLCITLYFQSNIYRKYDLN